MHNLESQAETVGLIPSANAAPLDGRVGAVTPAAQRLSRPLDAINVPHRKVDKICCIGAGYVGMSGGPQRPPRILLANQVSIPQAALPVL